ncbi:MAG TPA: phosphatase PAP2 family protein [Puia sp.]
MPFIEWLEHVDKLAFTLIQTHLSAPWLDDFMLMIRNPYTWIPLYGFMLYWALKCGKNTALKFICCTLVCFAITDYSSAQLFKPLFERLRPCYDADTVGIVRGIIGCGGKYSFPSSHAANHFGLAAFWYYSIHLLTRQKWRWLWIWAFLISFAQVYVGVHFPLDIAGGAILGLITGLGLAKLFESWIRPKEAKNSNNSSLSLP